MIFNHDQPVKKVNPAKNPASIRMVPPISPNEDKTLEPKRLPKIPPLLIPGEPEIPLP